MDPLRVVVDTNVIVSALISSRGASAELMRRVTNGTLAIGVTPAVLFEYQDVLTRPANLVRHDWRMQDIDNLVAALTGLAMLRLPSWRYRPLLPDPGDEMILEAAVATGSRAIITFNKRDFPIPAWFGIEILTPAELLGKLR